MVHSNGGATVDSARQWYEFRPALIVVANGLDHSIGGMLLGFSFVLAKMGTS